MKATAKQPRNLLEAVKYFSDLDVATDFVAKLRWPNGPVCPHCGGAEHSYVSTRRIWKCKACKKQFSVKVGTIFEDSALGFDKWLPAVWLIANSKNGISSYELARSLSITQKSAWFMLHRIRLAMAAGSFDRQLCGRVEVDETFVGGKFKNMHPSKRGTKAQGRGTVDKTVVMGFQERKGETRAHVVADTRKHTLDAEVRKHVEPGSTVYTDQLSSYENLSNAYDHGVINHTEAFVDGDIHTNGMENFWSLFKRGLKGTYVHADPAHLFRYLDERLFTYNLRDLSDAERFAQVLSAVTTGHLTYAALTTRA